MMVFFCILAFFSVIQADKVAYYRPTTVIVEKDKGEGIFNLPKYYEIPNGTCIAVFGSKELRCANHTRPTAVKLTITTDALPPLVDLRNSLTSATISKIDCSVSADVKIEFKCGGGSLFGIQSPPKVRPPPLNSVKKNIALVLDTNINLKKPDVNANKKDE